MKKELFFNEIDEDRAVNCFKIFIINIFYLIRDFSLKLLVFWKKEL